MIYISFADAHMELRRHKITHLKPVSNILRRNAFPWCVAVYDQSGIEDGCLKHKRVCQGSFNSDKVQLGIFAK